MPGLSVLFLGGTGIISSACVERARSVGMNVSVLNRGLPTGRGLPEGVRSLVADLGDPESVRTAVGGQLFDVVADFRAFVPADVRGRPGRLTSASPTMPLATYRFRHRFTVGRLIPTSSAIS